MTTLRAALSAALILLSAAPASAGATTYSVGYDAASATVDVQSPAGGGHDTFYVLRIEDEGFVWAHGQSHRYAISSAAAAAGCVDLAGSFPVGDGWLRCPLAGNTRGIRLATADGDDVAYTGWAGQRVPAPLRVTVADGPGDDVVGSHIQLEHAYQFETFPLRVEAGTGDDYYSVASGDAQLQVSYAARDSGLTATASGRASSSTGNGAPGEDDFFGGVFSVEGGSGADDLRTGEGRALVRGGPGPDILRDGPGSFHLLDGGDGDDRLVASGPGTSSAGDGLSRDELHGGPGSDTADYSHATAPVRLQPGTAANGVSGEATLIAPDIEGIVGGAGDDVLLGSPGPDLIEAGLGDDFVRAGAGADWIDAVDSRSFRDDLGCGSDGDTVRADVGFDLVGADCETVVTAPDGDGDGCSDIDETEVFGTDPANPDTDGDGVGDCEEATDDDCLDPLDPDSDDDGALDGDDAFPCDPSRQDPGPGPQGPPGPAGGGSSITINNNAIPTLAECDNRVAGSRNRDRMLGTSGDDRLLGRRGDDLVSGAAGRDCLLGNTGDDRVRGGPNPDRLLGGPGDDLVNSRDGVRDLVKCGAGKHDRAVADAIDLVVACELRRVR